MKKWYIKERHNPQLGVYYVAKGQLTKKEAKEYENAKYGENTMLSFETQAEYDAKIRALKVQGARFI